MVGTQAALLGLHSEGKEALAAYHFRKLSREATCFPGQVSKTPTAALPQLGPSGQPWKLQTGPVPSRDSLACLLSPGPDLGLMLITHLVSKWPAALPSHWCVSL